MLEGWAIDFKNAVMVLVGIASLPALAPFFSFLKRYLTEYLQVKKQQKSLWVENTFKIRSAINHTMNNAVNVLPRCHKMLVIKIHNGGAEIRSSSNVYTSVIFETYYMAEESENEDGQKGYTLKEISKSAPIIDAWQGVSMDSVQNAQVRHMLESKGKFLKVARSDLKEGISYKSAFSRYNVGCVYHSHCFTKQANPQKILVHSKEERLSKLFYVSFLFEDENYVASQRDLAIMRETNSKIAELIKEDLQFD